MFVPHAAFAQGPCMTLEGTCRTRGHFVARVAMLQTFACSDKYVQILLQYDFQLWVCCILYSYEFSRHINDKRLGAKSRAEMLRQQILRGSQDDFRRKVLTIWSICQMQSFVLCISSLCWSLAQCFSVQEGMQHFQSNMHGVRMTLFSVEPVLSSSAVHQVCIGLLLTVFRCSEISCLCCSRKATQIWTTFNQRGSKVPGSFCSKTDPDGVCAWQVAKRIDCFEADRASQRSHSLRMVCTLESALTHGGSSMFFWRSFWTPTSIKKCDYHSLRFGILAVCGGWLWF